MHLLATETLVLYLSVKEQGEGQESYEDSKGKEILLSYGNTRKPSILKGTFSTSLLYKHYIFSQKVKNLCFFLLL